MKYLKYTLLLCLCVVMNSCDEEEVLEFLEDPELDITTNFVIPLTVDVPASTDPDQTVFFFEGGTYDIISNPQVAEEIGEPDRIKKVVINSITYEYKNFTGNVDAVVEGDVALPGPDGDVFYTIPAENVAQSDLIGIVYTLNGDFTPANQRISELKGIGLIFSGSSSHNPVDFVVEFIINATVTVELNLDDL